MKDEDVSSKMYEILDAVSDGREVSAPDIAFHLSLTLTEVVGAVKSFKSYFTITHDHVNRVRPLTFKLSSHGRLRLANFRALRSPGPDPMVLHLHTKVFTRGKEYNPLI